jgi:hypothetical protein
MRTQSGCEYVFSAGIGSIWRIRRTKRKMWTMITRMNCKISQRTEKHSEIRDDRRNSDCFASVASCELVRPPFPRAELSHTTYGYSAPALLSVKPAPVTADLRALFIDSRKWRQNFRIKWPKKNRKMRFTAILPHFTNCKSLLEMTLPKACKKAEQNHQKTRFLFLKSENAQKDRPQRLSAPSGHLGNVKMETPQHVRFAAVQNGSDESKTAKIPPLPEK